MSRRFFLDTELPQSGVFFLTKKESPEEFHHLTRVLRLQVGDKAVFVNGRGQELEAAILAIGKEEIQLQVENFIEKSPDKGPVILCQALLKGAKMDWLVEKITEIGVAEFYPLVSNRVVRADAGQRSERWERIAKAAAKQSGNPRLPLLHASAKLPDFFSDHAWEKYARIVLHPGEGAPLFLTVLEESIQKETFTGLLLFIGPEGGFAEEEVQFLESKGVLRAQLSGAILRGETAGIVASAIARQAIALWA